MTDTTDLIMPAPAMANGCRADRRFCTEHLRADLKGRSVRGGAVTLASQGTKFVLQMGSTAVLARLLTPADFGLIAMVSAVTGFISLFRDMGLSLATVQRPEITHGQVSVLFWINVVISLGLAVICAALAPAIARFYHEPRLMWVTIAIASTFIFGGMAAQHTALLQRQMRFFALAASDITAMACGIGVAIWLALIGASYWALVALIAVQAVVGLIGVWLGTRWWPGMPRRGTGVMPMLKFGGNLTGFNFLNYFTRNFDNVLVGAVLGAGPLGFYSKAYNLLMMPITQINGPMSAVALPGLSRLQQEPIRFRSYYLRAIEVITFCGMPLVAFTFMEADNLVQALLGPQWAAAVPVFRWLAPAAFIGTLNVAPGWLFASLGNTHRQFHWAIITAPVSIAAFVVGLHWGLIGVAAAFSLTWSVMHISCIIYSCLGSPVRPHDIVLRVWRSAVTSLLALLATALALSIVTESSSVAIRLICASATYAFIFLGLWLAFPGGPGRLRELYKNTSQLWSKADQIVVEQQQSQ